MIIDKAVEQGLVTGAIAGVSAIIAITATHPALPGGLDIFTAALAGILAGLVRYATIREIPNP